MGQPEPRQRVLEEPTLTWGVGPPQVRVEHVGEPRGSLNSFLPSSFNPISKVRPLRPLLQPSSSDLEREELFQRRRAGAGAAAAPWVCASREPSEPWEAGERSRCSEGTGLPRCRWSLLSSVSQAAGEFSEKLPTGSDHFFQSLTLHIPRIIGIPWMSKLLQRANSSR